MPQYTLQFNNQHYRFRNKNIFQFLRLIKDKHPHPTQLQDIEKALPKLSGKQLARYVELLEERELPLLHYHTKTRGPYRLCVPYEALLLPAEDSTNSAHTPPAQAQAQLNSAPTPSIAHYFHPAWKEWVDYLTQAHLCLHSTHFSYEEGSNFGFLEQARSAARHLPKWTRYVVDVCHAHHLERASEYRKASYYLRKIESAALHQQVPPIVVARARLCRAKILYDQGRYADSENILNQVQLLNTHFPPLWRNVQGLLTGQQLNQSPSSSPQLASLLDKTLASFLDGMTDIFMQNGDYSVLDALSFNYANNLYRAIKKELIASSHIKTVLEWFLLNIFICREIGIGDHSIYTHLLMVDIIDEFELDKSMLPKQLLQHLGNAAARRQYLQKYLKVARKSGNRVEIAECLLRLAQRENEDRQAKTYFAEAMELGLGLDNKTLLKDIRAAIASRKRTNKLSK